MVDETQKIRGARPGQQELLEELLKKIACQAKRGDPYTKTGKSGVYQKRHEFPGQFHQVGKHRFESLVQDLLDDKEITRHSRPTGPGVSRPA